MESPPSDDACIVSSSECGHPFCNLPASLVQLIASVSSSATYRRKTKLFVEGQKPRGVFILRTGKAKLTTCSMLGKTIITRLADPGDVLGLNAVVSSRPYGATADMMTNGQVDFIARDSLLRLMRERDEFALVIMEQLSASYYPLHDAVRSLGLTTHPVERLAKLLLSWTSTGNENAGANDHSFKLPLTHQEIADSIGSTRETVSKLFSELKKKNLLRSEGRELTIMNRLELQRIVQF
ncbi:MAG TPA: Crp/Fnr family transcriptional regulator [Candidatus Binatia bacterium]|nr:Crp/Fnr family transcriptional regulator [Candidatus Binatia bacterium]